MTKKITVGAKEFKYRVVGDQVWTNLRGGITHELEFYSGASVEFSSILDIAHIEVHGEIKSVDIGASSINSLTNSFSNSPTLENVNIVTSNPILNLEDTFANTGVVDTVDVILDLTTTETLRGTFRSTPAIGGTLTTDTLVLGSGDIEGFYASNVSTIKGRLERFRSNKRFKFKKR